MRIDKAHASQEIDDDDIPTDYRISPIVPNRDGIAVEIINSSTITKWSRSTTYLRKCCDV